MRIAVDVSPLSHPPTGIGNYLRGLVGGLAEAGGHEIVAFAPTSLRGPARIRAALGGARVQTRLWPLPWSHAVRTGWSRLGRPAAERLLGEFDALLYSDWMYPPQRGGVRATVVHDLVPVHHPEWCTARTIAMHTAKYADAARTCDVIVANSGYTAADVRSTLDVAADRVVVAHPAVGTEFVPDGPRFELDRPYVLGVGTFEPRKNLTQLVAAWRMLGDDVRLVLAGGSGWGDQPQLADDSIVRLGYVPHDELPRLYRGAAAYVYPSLFEGFGIPVIEAMACGAPVVASSHASLDDAAGDAALRADPRDAEQLADRIREAIDRRETLAAAGLAHAARFSWSASAATVLAAFEAHR